MSAAATIQRYAVSSGISGHVEYIVKVDYNGKVWPIRKRYSEFDQVDRKLRKKGYDLPNKLPPKLMWGNLTEETINRRVRDLDVYLASLVAHVPSDDSLLKEFLEVEANMLSLAIKSTPTIAHVNAADRIREIVRVAEHSFVQVDAAARLKECSEVPAPKRNVKSPKKKKLQRPVSASPRSNRHKSFASSVGSSHDSRKISNASSSNMDAADANLLRHIIRDKYLAQANNVWPSPEPPTTPLKKTASMELPDEEQVQAISASSVGALGGEASPSIYDFVERCSNDLYIEQRHVLSLLSRPVSTTSLRRMDDMAQVVDRIAKTQCSFISVPLTDVIIDVLPSSLAEEVSPSRPRSRRRKKISGPPRVRPAVVATTPMRLRHTASDAPSGNDLPGSHVQGGGGGGGVSRR
jgi:hypothetical protein